MCCSAASLLDKRWSVDSRLWRLRLQLRLPADAEIAGSFLRRYVNNTDKSRVGLPVGGVCVTYVRLRRTAVLRQDRRGTKHLEALLQVSCCKEGDVLENIYKLLFINIYMIENHTA